MSVRSQAPATLGNGRQPPVVAAAARVQSRPDIAARLLWTLVGCALINWSVQLLSSTTSQSWVAVPVVLAGGWGLMTVVASWLPSSIMPGARWMTSSFAWLTALVVVVAFTAWAYTQVRAGPGYGTDELAFDQYAAELLRQGLNPYAHSMAPALGMFHVSPDGYTYTLGGSPVTRLSYPALSFLLYLPFLALGWSSQLGVALSVAAWAVTVLLIFALLPSRIRAVALLVGSVSVYVSYAVGGVTDVLYMPLLVMAAYRWDRFGDRRLSYQGPVALGLAMAIKQTPWLLLPFILCALALDRSATDGIDAALRRCGGYLGAVLVAFFACNIPFIIASPERWVSGVLTPLVSHLVPAGQGAVALSLFLRLGGGSLGAYSVATGVLILFLVILYAGTFPVLRAVTFLLPALVLFFASRSYGSYLVSLIPAALIGAVTCRSFTDASMPVDDRLERQPVYAVRSRRWVVGIAVGAIAFGLAVAHALTDRQPLSVRIIGIRTTGQLATIQEIRLRVVNHSRHSVRPAFSIDEGDQVTTFWHATSGPHLLAPGASAPFVIQAPNYPAQPSIAGGFTVLAFSRGPAAVSATGAYAPSTTHIALSPDAVNFPVRLGHRVTIRAELLDPLDRRVRQAGIPVYMGQIIYDQSGLELAEAQINGDSPGQTPVTAYTNSRGVATFRVRSLQGGADPVYFEANLVSSRQFFPYGYSQILPIRFGR